MPTFNVDKEEITAFDTGDTYIFKAYFDEDSLFNHLQKYYNADKYRFEIPENNGEEVEQILEKYFYGMEVTDEFKKYCVVVSKDTDSSEILKNSVLRKQRSKHDIFVMKDEISARQAVEEGATPITESKIEAGNLQWQID